MLSDKVIIGNNLSETWRNMIRYFYDRKTKEIFGIETIIRSPFEEKKWPKEIEREVTERNYVDTIDNLTSTSRLTGRRIIEQLDEVIYALKHSEASQRAVIVTIDPSKDYSIYCLDQSYEIPVFVSIDFKITSKLHTIACIRNCEAFVWWPINVLQLSRLISIVVERTNSEIGSLVIFSDRAYVEDNDYEKIGFLVKTWCDIT